MSSAQIAHDDFRNAVIGTYGSVRVTRTHQRIAVGMVDEVMEWAFEAPLHGEYYDVICHGARSEDALVVAAEEATYLLSARQLADLILAQPDAAGKPVRLLACWVGQHPDGFAHQLDALLGYVGVLACTGALGVGYAEVYPISGARWRLFQRGQSTFMA